MGVEKIVITGGPGTGKSSIITELKNRNYYCLDEISRQITIDAQKQGTDQLFLTNPILFSKLLLKGRLKQYRTAHKTNAAIAFFDRGIPDVLAYLNYIDVPYPNEFVNTAEHSVYDNVFILKPWAAIYKSDNERYENFKQAETIYKHIDDTYQKFGYKLINVPFGTVAERTDFILHTIHN